MHVAADTIGNFLKLAHETNNKNAIRESCALTDLCWSLLDYGLAAGEGVVQGVTRIGHMATHPGETLKEIGCVATNLAYVLCEFEAMGDITSPADKKWAKETMQIYTHKINELEKALNHALSTASGPDLVRAGTAMATEIWLTGRITAAAQPLFKAAKSHMVEVVKTVWKGASSEAVLAGEAEIRIAAETYDQIALMQANKSKQAGTSASKATTGTTQAEVKAGHAAQEVSSLTKEVSKIAESLHFSGDEALKHFDKHGKRIMKLLGKEKYNLQDYLNDANHVIQTGRFVPECNAYVKLIGTMGKKEPRFAFVGLNRLNGTITTFHIKDILDLMKDAPSLGLEFVKPIDRYI